MKTKRWFWILIFSYFQFFHCFSQTSDLIDSLIKVSKTDLSDQERVDIYNQIAYQFDTDSAQVSKYSFAAINLGTKIEYQEGISIAYDNLAWMSLLTGYFDIAEKYWNEALSLAKTSSYWKGEAKAYNGLGLLRQSQGKHSESVDYFLKSLAIMEREEYTVGLAPAYNNIGTIYSDQSEFEKALKFYQKALEIDENLGNRGGIAYDYNNIGNVYRLLDKHSDALEYYFKALEIKKDLGNKKDLASTYNNIGATYNYLGDYNLAIKYNQQSVKLYQEAQVKKMLASPLIEIGKAFKSKGEFQKSLNYLNDALLIAQNIGEASTIADCYRTLSQIYAQMNMFEQAYKSHVNYKQVYDNLQNENTTKKIAKLESEYQFKKELDSINYENKAQRLYLEKNIEKRKSVQLATFIVLTLTIVLIVVLFIFYQSKIKTNRLLSQKTFELENAKIEISQQNQQLQETNKIKDRVFSIIAHDLSSPIHALQGLITLFKSDYELSQELVKEYMNRLSKNIEGVSSLLKNLLFWANSQIKNGKSLKPTEVNLLPIINETVFQLSETAKVKSIETVVKVENSLPTLFINEDSLKFILRNLLNNAYKFSHPNEKVILSAERRDAFVKISIQDTGIGMNNETLNSLFHDIVNSQKGTKSENGSGIGLMLCKEFVDKSGGEIGAKSKVNEGSLFWFTVPIDNNPKINQQKVTS